MTVFIEIFLCKLYFHFSPMFLQAQIRMFLEPPWGDLALANTTKNGGRGRVLGRIGLCGRSFG
jgi:hypothetical protein